MFKKLSKRISYDGVLLIRDRQHSCGSNAHNHRSTCRIFHRQDDAATRAAVIISKSGRSVPRVTCPRARELSWIRLNFATSDDPRAAALPDFLPHRLSPRRNAPSRRCHDASSADEKRSVMERDCFRHPVADETICVDGNSEHSHSMTCAIRCRLLDCRNWNVCGWRRTLRATASEPCQ